MKWNMIICVRSCSSHCMYMFVCFYLCTIQTRWECCVHIYTFLRTWGCIAASHCKHESNSKCKNASKQANLNDCSLYTLTCLSKDWCVIWAILLMPVADEATLFSRLLVLIVADADNIHRLRHKGTPAKSSFKRSQIVELLLHRQTWFRLSVCCEDVGLQKFATPNWWRP